MTGLAKRRFVLVIVLIAFGMGFLKASAFHPATVFQFGTKAAQVSNVRFQSRFASSKQQIQTHGASVVALKDGRIRAFWFSGSREGAKDVEIHSAVFDPAHELWGPEQAVATREGTQQSVLRYVSKLGNPVAARTTDGALSLYYVTVSMGGWAGSSITAMTSQDEGETWSPPRRLISSPFLNISTLVKGAPFLYSDGTLGLPVYHEFISKFGEILRLDKTGAVIDKQRLSAGGDRGLQPVVLVTSPNDALVLMRNAGAGAPHRAISVSTHDAGQHWTAPTQSALSNPDAALSAAVLPDGRILAVLNDIEQGRDALSLVISADGGSTWKTVHQLEDQTATRKQPLDEVAYLKVIAGLAHASVAAGTDVNSYVESVQRQVCEEHGCRFEFSYPYLIQTQAGDFHLVYTWNRSFIKHIWFTQAWLDQSLEKSAHDPLH